MKKLLISFLLLLAPLLAVAQLPAPTLIAPANDTTGVSVYTTFEWESVEGADYYLLHASAHNPSEMVLAAEVTGTSYTRPQAFQGQRLHDWRVRAVSGDTRGEWSPVWQFTTTTLANSAAPEVVADTVYETVTDTVIEFIDDTEYIVQIDTVFVDKSDTIGVGKAVRGLTDVSLTATGRYYHTYIDTVTFDGNTPSFHSQHTAEREAIEKILQLKERFPESYIWYTHEYQVRLEGNTVKAITYAEQKSDLLGTLNVWVTPDSLSDGYTLTLQANSQADSVVVRSLCTEQNTKSEWVEYPSEETFSTSKFFDCQEILFFYVIGVGENDRVTVAKDFIDIVQLRESGLEPTGNNPIEY